MAKVEDQISLRPLFKDSCNSSEESYNTCYLKVKENGRAVQIEYVPTPYFCLYKKRVQTTQTITTRPIKEEMKTR